jgi:Protein of unknown function (DUF3040)
VPLSREEQQVLDEIERFLAAEDPGFVGRIERQRRRIRRILMTAIVGLICGVTLLSIGVVGTDPGHVVLAVIGFGVIVASCSSIITHTGRRVPKPMAGRRSS